MGTPVKPSAESSLNLLVAPAANLLVEPAANLLVATMSNIVGTYNLTESENFDEFMKAIGVGMVMRKMANSVKPDLIFSVDGDTYTMTTKSSFKTSEVKFKLGEKFAEKTLDERDAQTTFTLEGDVLTQTQECSKGPSVKYIRTFTAAGLSCVCEAGAVKAVRNYKRA